MDGERIGGSRGRAAEFEAHGDVGAPKLPGTAAYNAASQEYGMSAAGVNM